MLQLRPRKLPRATIGSSRIGALGRIAVEAGGRGRDPPACPGPGRSGMWIWCRRPGRPARCEVRVAGAARAAGRSGRTSAGTGYATPGRPSRDYPRPRRSTPPRPGRWPSPWPTSRPCTARPPRCLPRPSPRGYPSHLGDYSRPVACLSIVRRSSLLGSSQDMTCQVFGAGPAVLRGGRPGRGRRGPSAVYSPVD